MIAVDQEMRDRVTAPLSGGKRLKYFKSFSNGDSDLSKGSPVH
jgi:hypothetical protein